MEILNLSQYEAKSHRESPSRDGYINYGEDNLFPQYLVDLYQSSATHNALCTSIAYMIFGEGLKTEDLDAKLKIQEWGLDDEIRRACLDLKIQGGFALEVIYSLDRTTISKVRHLPFENVRSGDINDREEVDFYYYSRDWSDARQEPQVVHAFNPEQAVDFPVQILYVKPFSVGSFFYPKPDFIGSVNYIELDKEISVFHINNIKNGLAPSFMIHFKNGTPPPEDRRKIRNEIETQLAGASNTGKFFITFSDSPERAPDFEPFPMNDLDKQYQFLSTEVTDKIMIAHRAVSPAMFGVKTAGQLGSTQELEVASELFDRQVIKPFQRVVNKALTSLFNAAGVTESVKLTLPEPVKDIVEETALESDLECEGFQELAHDFLMECGEDIDEDWELVDEREVDYDTEDSHDALWDFTREEPTRLEKALDNIKTFARVPSTTAQKKSSQDTSILKVRYVYAPQTYDTKTYKSRDFCRKMVNAKRVYRREDIIAAGKQVVNKGWGPNGKDTYSIWRYKGGGSCAHFWSRQTFLLKNNKKLTAKQARAEINKLAPDERKAATPVKNPKKVAKLPRDMANRGFLPSNKAAKNITTPK